ncbi:MAG: DNA methyltransferase [Gammaproteobacteria bacterium]
MQNEMLKERIRRLYIGDNARVLRFMPTESIDLIYLDPPFNSKKQWAAPIGSPAEGAEFKDTWTLTDIKADELTVLRNRDELRAAEGFPRVTDLIKVLGMINGESWVSYLTFMAVRIFEMHRILKPTGSLYFHCDPTMSHGVKLLLDAIFGEDNFRNEIVWEYHRFSRQSKQQFPRMHDVILFFSKSKINTFDCLTVDKRPDENVARGYRVLRQPRKVLVYDWEKYNAQKSRLEVDGYKVSDCTKLSATMGTVWDVPHIHSANKESVGYPTQKPLQLLERIIKASSKPGDVVLDPFCGCGTACVAAAELERSFIGIDVSQTAADIMKKRMQEEKPHLLDQWEKCEITHVVNASRIFRKRPDVAREERIVKDDAHRQMLYEKQEGKCAGCREEEKLKNLDNDRIIAGALGGFYTKDNVQLLCGRCNSKKRDRTMSELRADLKAEYLKEKTEQARREFEMLHFGDIDDSE